MKVTKFFCHSFHRYSIKHITNIFTLAPCHFLTLNTFSGLELFRIQKFSLSLWAPDMQKMPCSTLKNDLGRTNLEKDFAIKPCHFSQMKAVFSYPLIFSTAQETLFHIHEKHLFDSQMYSPSVHCVWQEHTRWNQPSCFPSLTVSSFICFVPVLSLSSHEGPPCLSGEQMRLTFVRRTWDGSAVACWCGGGGGFESCLLCTLHFRFWRGG